MIKLIFNPLALSLIDGGQLCNRPRQECVSLSINLANLTIRRLSVVHKINHTMEYSYD